MKRNRARTVPCSALMLLAHDRSPSTQQNVVVPSVVYPGGEGAWDIHGSTALLGCSLLSSTITSSAIKNSWGEVNLGSDAAAVAISVGLCCGSGGGEAAPAEASEMSEGYIVGGRAAL